MGVIAAGHKKTVWAGEEILRSGGNAYDAALAAVAAACVVEPTLVSFAAGGYLLADPADGRSVVYDFFVKTPLQARPENELDFFSIDGDFGEATQVFHIGKGSTAVPGQVLGMFEIHKDLGSMPMQDILQPAICLARDGVRITTFQAFLFSVLGAVLKAGKSCMEIYGSREKEGALVQEGEILKQPEMADFMEALALEGPDLFYRGEIAQALEGDMKDGGMITKADLEVYEVERNPPLKVNYRDALIEMNPPPATGGLLNVFGLKMLEQFDVGSFKPGSESYLLHLADVLSKTMDARVALDGLAGDQERISAVLDESFLAPYRSQIAGRPRAVHGTTHISVIDKDKNMASMTVSNGQSNNYTIPGTGVMTNNMLGEDWLNPDGFHRWQPGTRMTSMMVPAAVSWSDGRRLALGSGGCDRIRTAILQVMLNLIDFKMSAEDAVKAPRIHIGDDMLNVEGGFVAEEIELLCKAYPDNFVWEDLNLYFGGVHMAGFGEGGFNGFGDPRRDGACEVL